MVKTPSFHCQEHMFDPWLRNQDPHKLCSAAKKKKKKIKVHQYTQLKHVSYNLLQIQLNAVSFQTVTFCFTGFPHILLLINTYLKNEDRTDTGLLPWTYS